jgi:dihydrofolate synthase/folylpolyglutamate synthase
MTYQETIQYLDSFINYEKKSAYPYRESFKLERIKEFLAAIGNPQEALKCIHVAGTKGKGSVCAFCAHILKEAGYKVGLYTSPHLSDVRERIRVLAPDVTTSQSHKVTSINKDFEGMISPEELESLAGELKPKIDEYSKNSIYGPLSFFEVYTALAFAYFKAKKVDLAVLETGLGGRLDATNVVDPLICGITSISLDHTKQLGDTLPEIAREKAGIIKSHKVTTSQGHKLVVITAPQETEVLAVLKDKCRQEDALLYEIGREIIFEQTPCGAQSPGFNMRGAFGEYNDLKIRLSGRHQLINATLALGLIAGLIKSNQIKVKIQDIKNGLYNTVWPGRFEIVSRSPFIVLDGAHNAASAKALRETLEQEYPDKNITIILGISHDKDVQGICRELAVVGSQFILTQADNPRALPPQEILPQLRAYKAEDALSLSANLKEALNLAGKKTDGNSLIVVTGSLFLAGQARGLFKR